MKISEHHAGTVTLGVMIDDNDAVIFENSHIRVAVLPKIGAKIHQFLDKRTAKDLLFHHPRVEVRPPVFGANVDNWWTGGIDDAFPTGQPAKVNGEDIPFLGEVWSMPWKVESLSPNSVKFSRMGVITPFLMEKVLTLDPDDNYLTVDYCVTNIGTTSFPYIWGIHPAFPISTDTRIHIPAGNSWYVDGTGPFGTSEEFQKGEKSEKWPIKSLAELSSKDPLSWEYYYLSDLDDGWLAITDHVADTGFALTFDRKTFPNIHIWMVNGGWRGIRTIAIEPWTAMPAGLDHAMTAGTARELQVHESVTTQVKMIAFTPTTHINGFTEKGELL
ncbi:unannotated protein [freshwater metagenome]|uniref:Unannotated protein n=1 Tax=freshwater metagenome TaxID=449393 RepID=A0A6J7XUN0_9ZZZZ|nr:DUF5107 domain-containing protein [Actinomycetota bacterium]